jgi:peptidoglycan/xylan/chitin deacetylase (PgdA/CDA1 family)
MLTTACLLPPPGGETLQRSDDYILYRLPGKSTAAELAARFLGDPRRAWLIEEANPRPEYLPGETVIIPLKNPNPGGLSRDGYQVVPVLCYHRFAPRCQSALCIPEEAFSAHLDYLRTNGYRSISLGELAEFLAYNRALPRKAVVITIDDGYRSTFEIAFPLLKRYGFTATLFIYSDFVGSSSLAMTWDHIRQMQAEGFEIGSHSLSHADLTLRRPEEDEAAFRRRITDEVVRSKAILDRELQQETQFFAYPYSKHDPFVLALVAAHYRLGLTVERGANPFFADPLRLKRTQVLQADLGPFAGIVETLKPLALE